LHSRVCGAVRDALRRRSVIDIELNAVTDNPLIPDAQDARRSSNQVISAGTSMLAGADNELRKAAIRCSRRSPSA
jgi:histidine ammonia-lyase